jgi:hypothetical protein
MLSVAETSQPLENNHIIKRWGSFDYALELTGSLVTSLGHNPDCSCFWDALGVFLWSKYAKCSKYFHKITKNFK